MNPELWNELILWGLGMVSLVLMLIGLGFIIYEKPRPATTIEEALSELGERGGTLYLKPGHWLISDKCVSGVVKR